MALQVHRCKLDESAVYYILLLLLLLLLSLPGANKGCDIRNLAGGQPEVEGEGEGEEEQVGGRLLTPSQNEETEEEEEKWKSLVGQTLPSRSGVIAKVISILQASSKLIIYR